MVTEQIILVTSCISTLDIHLSSWKAGTKLNFWWVLNPQGRELSVGTLGTQTPGGVLHFPNSWGWQRVNISLTLLCHCQLLFSRWMWSPRQAFAFFPSIFQSIKQQRNSNTLTVLKTQNIYARFTECSNFFQTIEALPQISYWSAGLSWEITPEELG